MLFRNIRVDSNLTTGTLEFLRTRIKDIASSSFKEFKEFLSRDSNFSKDEHIVCDRFGHTKKGIQL